jgi:hypothetical protein
MLANDHNVLFTPSSERPYGIKVSLRRSDPFTLLVGKDWKRAHWYATAAERDAAYGDMLRHHEYSRQGDEPAIKLEKIG